MQEFVRLCCAQHKRTYVASEVMLRSSVESSNHAPIQRCQRNISNQRERRKAIVVGSLFHGRLETAGVESALVWLSICALRSRSTSA